MATMTKSQLVDENIRLRAHSDALESQLKGLLAELGATKEEAASAALQRGHVPAAPRVLPRGQKVVPTYAAMAAGKSVKVGA